MKYLSFLFFLISLGSFNSLYAQEEVIIANPVDSLYREDQFYLNISYNMMQNKPADYQQRGYFSNLGFGFLRDIPLNKRRNVAVAPGIGYTYSRTNSNLFIQPENNLNLENNIVVVDRSSYDKNILTYHNLDIPIEFRWRTSVPETHKFFRIYAGVKFSYIFANQSNFKSPAQDVKVTGIKEIKNFQTGLYLALGYNTWNVYTYYGLTPLLETKNQSSEQIKMNTFHIGLAFYIL